jgi:hypothetical protein
MSIVEIIAASLSVFGGLCVIGLVYIQASEIAKWKRRAIEAECEVRLLREENVSLTNRRRVGITYEYEKGVA